MMHRQRTSGSSRFAVMALALVLVLALAWLIVPSSPADELPALDDELPEQLDVDRLIERLQQIGAHYPEADYELAALADRLGSDPGKAFEYVRDQIDYEPYPGMLRGAKGTLSGRAGNHLDRALLLRELMRAQGVDARLVVGQVSARSAGSLKQRPLAAERVDTDRPDPALGLIGLGENALARLKARGARDEKQLIETLGDRIDRVEPNDGADIERKRHAWVQARVRGEWVDFDPTLATAEAGQTLGYFEAAVDDAAEAEVHTVGIELFAESLSADGTLRRESLLSEELVAADAAPAQIFLTFAPDIGSSAFGAGTLTRAAGEEVRYRPSLMVDGEIHIGRKLPPIAQTKSEAQSFLFGEDDAAPVLAALQLEVTARIPGGETKRTRILFDRVPAADRGAGDYAVDRLLPIQRVDTTPYFLGSVHQFVVSNGSADPHQLAEDIAFGIDFFGREMLDPERFKERSLHELLWPIGARNLALALAAERLSVASLNDRPDLHFFVGAPRIYLMSIVPRSRSDIPTRDLEIDLLVDHVAWVGTPDTAARDVTERRIRYGVLQQALETTLAELAAVAIGLDSSAVSSASQELEAGLRIVEMNEQGTGDIALAMLNDAESGSTVLISPGQFETWWTFDPGDGALAARLAPGLGGVKLGGTLPRSSSAGGAVGDMVRRPQGPGGVYRQVGNRLIREGAGSPTNNCSGGGTEYTIVMCNVSIKISMTTGWAYTIIAGEIVAAVAATLMQLP